MDNCLQLKDAIKDLIEKGFLTNYIVREDDHAPCSKLSSPRNEVNLKHAIDKDNTIVETVLELL